MTPVPRAERWAREIVRALPPKGYPTECPFCRRSVALISQTAMFGCPLCIELRDEWPWEREA